MVLGGTTGCETWLDPGDSGGVVAWWGLVGVWRALVPQNTENSENSGDVGGIG